MSDIRDVETAKSATLPMTSPSKTELTPCDEELLRTPCEDVEEVSETELDLHQLVRDIQTIPRVDLEHIQPADAPHLVLGHLRPSREAIFTMVEELLTVIFPGYFGPSEVSEHTTPFYFGTTLDRIMRILQEQIRRCLCFNEPETDRGRYGCIKKAKRLTQAFMKRLPEVRRRLYTDVLAGYVGDPAATSTDEVIFCYPGLLALAYQRAAHELYKLQIPILPRLITERAHSLTGIDIHPGARIDDGLFIDHGTGVVIGETATIGKNVRIYQGVTLGAKSFPLDEHGNPIKGIKRHPNLEDDVVVYSGATILGAVTIGQGSVIGGNVWLTSSVPACSYISQSSNRVEMFAGGAGI